MYIEAIWEPYEMPPNEDNDTWVGELTIPGGHISVIEVRAMDEQTLKQRLNTIINAFDGDIKHFKSWDETPSSPEDDYDRAMGILG